MYLCNRTQHVVRVYNPEDCTPSQKVGAFESQGPFTLIPEGTLIARVTKGEDAKHVNHVLHGIVSEEGVYSKTPGSVAIVEEAPVEGLTPADWGEPYTYYIVSREFFLAAQKVRHFALDKMLVPGPAVNVTDPDTRGCAGFRRG